MAAVSKILALRLATAIDDPRLVGFGVLRGLLRRHWRGDGLVGDEWPGLADEGAAVESPDRAVGDEQKVRGLRLICNQAPGAREQATADEHATAGDWLAIGKSEVERHGPQNSQSDVPMRNQRGSRGYTRSTISIRPASFSARTFFSFSR